MSARKADNTGIIKINTKAGSGIESQGVNSCQSCGYVNYNGSTCGLSVSPYYGKKVTPETYCIYHSPRVGRNIPL